jgi:O-antigen/teichoic acid export membrane protein
MRLRKAQRRLQRTIGVNYAWRSVQWGGSPSRGSSRPLAPMSEPIPSSLTDVAGDPSRGSRLQISARGAVLGSVASGLAGQAALVVTGIVTTRTLGATDRGYLALVVLVPVVLQLVGTLGLPVASTYYIATDPHRESAVLHAIRRPAFLQVLVLSTLQALILWLLVSGDPERVHWAAIATLPLLAGALADIYGKAILQGQGRYTAFNILRNGAVVFYLVGVVVLLATGQTGLVEFTIAWVSAALLAGVVTLAVALRHRAPASPDADVSRSDLLRYGLRGYLVSLSPVATFRLDQALIGLFLAPRALGLYVAALSLTNLPDIIARGIGMIALPQVARAQGTARALDFRRYLWFTILLTGIAVLGLEILAGWLVPFFFGSEFEDAVLVTRILLIGTFFWGVRRVLTDATSGSGRPGLGSIAELASWIAIIPALALLMPLWGVEGVATAMTISSAASLLVLLVLVLGSNRAVRADGAGRGRSRPAEVID